MLHFVLAVLLQPAATPSPAPDPCKAAHRLICGPIRFVPRDSQERQAFIGNTIATLVDGIVTAQNTRGNPALEGNPVVRPFVRGGLPDLLLGWASMEVAQRSVAHTFHLSDERMETFTMRQHVSGVASWLSPRTYAWTPDEWESYHQPFAEDAWIRFDASGGRY